MIGIVDYNMGNLRSVENAFARLHVPVTLVSDPKALAGYEKIILPGVGAFGDAMQALERAGMKEAVCDFAKSGKPLLGICLGMQLLFESSSEFGQTKGLGVIEGEVVGFDTSRFKERLKVPHMGWNRLHVTQQTPLFKGVAEDVYLYFVHSYHVVCEQRYCVGESEYGYTFASAVQKGMIFGFQPHPEKSHDNGLKILQNFVELG